tara:strand:+ start:1164 stop:4544 length:3381 start_codon:yes stop_codon:yes gene_type:complete
MPEIKNTFLKSKMNKDLDARLVPNGEYRDAQNVSISRSEGSDVGALENVLGNTQLTNLKVDIAALERQKATDKYGTTIRPGEIEFPNLEIIGYYTDTATDKIFIFLTDYSDSSSNRVSNFAPADYIDTSGGFPGVFIYKGAGCYIVEYDVLTNTKRVLIAGNFLNFSKTHPIINVNLLEDLLFWTDNRNQPRKINLQKAFDDSYEFSGTNDPYYYNEDHISVAKFAPVESFSFLDLSDNSTLISNSEEYLPAHIITNATNYNSGTGALTLNGTYSISGSNPDLFGHATNGDLVTIGDTDQSYVASSVQTQSVIIQSGLTVNLNYKIKIQRRNPDYNADYKGDTRLLQDKFSKFSYRFKYDDGEYSLMAPFTQAAFVPKQFGYFINNDEETTLQSGNVKFMENRVDQVKLNLTLPYAGDQLKNKLKIQEIQILIKNSDEQAVRVIEDVDVSNLTNTTNYEYNYLSTKAIKTLPEAELIRVHDKVPVRALAQEVVSNRVIYGNFLDKHSSPDNLKYDLIYNEKTYPSGGSANDEANRDLTTEFPMHTLKQNRSYQVGVVLVDRYGRASNVILNSEEDIATGNKNSTIYAPYTNFGSDSVSFWGNYIEFNLRGKVPNTLSKEGYPGLYSETNPLGYYSYRIVVKQQEQDYYNVYTPGALAGDLTWDTVGFTKLNTNTPVTAGAGNADFLPSFSHTNSIALLNLFGDNVNKIPRELEEVNGNDVTFSSRVILYNRVNPLDSHNVQSTVSKQGEKVISIEPFRQLGDWTTTKGKLFPGGNTTSDDSAVDPVPTPWYPYFVSGATNADFKFNFHDIFFEAQSNPFIAKIETDFKIGVTPTYNNKADIESAFQDLGVFETIPTKSVLDIYWETSTSGLISDLNNEVVATTPVGVKDSAGNNTALGQNIQYIHTEADSSGSDATLFFELVDAGGVLLTTNSSLTIQSVIDGTNADRSSEFQILTDNTGSVTKYKIQTNALFTFNNNANINENYTFNLLATDTSASPIPLYTNAPIQFKNCQLQNVAPSFVNQPPANPAKVDRGQDLFTMTANSFLNGSADTNRNKEQLSIVVVNFATEVLYPEIFVSPTTSSSQDRVIKTTAQAVDGMYKLKLTDANGNGLSTFSNGFNVIFNI